MLKGIRKVKAGTAGSVVITLLLSLVTMGTAQAQDRWFQVEISIFTQENFDPDGLNPNRERWLTDLSTIRYPRNLRKLSTLAEALGLSDWSVLQPVAASDDIAETETVPVIGPRAFNPSSDFALPDINRTPFMSLPAEQHEFSDTNRAIDRSASHRLLYHAAWRQVVRQPGASSAIAVSGGTEYSGRHELEGSVRFRFNPNEDRVVVDADLWLIRFAMAAEDEQIALPELPDVLLPAEEMQVERLGREPGPVRLFQMQQSRDMRSNEFHYLDHPALGIVVMVKPYSLPEPANQPFGAASGPL